MNEKLGLTGVYQNHAGSVFGASMWEIWQILEGTRPKAMGSQYDIRHAMVEGGRSWPNGLRLIESRISSLVAKDYKWEEVDGKWELMNTPLGMGMVDFVAYFKLLKQYGIKVPISLHFEYPMGGADHGHKNWKAGPKIKSLR